MTLTEEELERIVIRSACRYTTKEKLIELILKWQKESKDMAGFLEEFGCKDWYEWGALYSRVAQEAWKFTYLEQAWKKINVDLDDAGDCMKFCKEYKRIREEKD